MTEQELLVKIRELKEIKPRPDWVILKKSQILGEEIKAKPANSFVETVRFLIQPRLALASLVVFGVLIGVFSFAQSSLPGDLFYPLKKIAEKSGTVLLSGKEQRKQNLEFVKKRLDELSQVAKGNKVKNLGPAINEFQASVSEVAKTLAQEKNKIELKNTVKEIQNIEEKTTEIKSLGVEVGENLELDSALIQLLKNEVEELGNQKLTTEEISSLGNIKKDIETGNYSQALEKLLVLKNLNNLNLENR